MWSLALGFSVLALLLYAAYAAISVIWQSLSEANPQFSGAITAAIAAIIGVTLSVFGGKWLERQALIAKELRDKKSPIYENLLKFMIQ